MTNRGPVRPLALAALLPALAALLPALAALALAGCGDDAGAECGNGEVEADELCDDPAAAELAASSPCTSLCAWQEFTPADSESDGSMHPDVAMNRDGRYVVVWRGRHELEEDIWAIVYHPSGEAAGPVFRVNEDGEGNQQFPRVDMDEAGSFVVVWQNHPDEPGNERVWMRAFDPEGVAVSGDIQLNTWTENRQVRPAVAVNANGRTVVAWASDEQDGDLMGVYARRADSNGQLVDTEPFQVNTAWEGDQEDASVAVADDGRFVIAWGPGQEST
jgi:hypothetical protein